MPSCTQRSWLFLQLSSNTKIKSSKLHSKSYKIHNLTLFIQKKISALGELVAGIAHEINNPLGFVSGSIGHVRDHVSDLTRLLKLYQDTYGKDNTEIATLSEEINLDFVVKDLLKILHSMEIGSNRMTKIVRSLKNFSRQTHQTMQPANLHKGIDNTLLLLNNRLRMAGKQKTAITVIKRYSELPEITCDMSQLNQVFMNLLANAIEAFERDSCRCSGQYFQAFFHHQTQR